ncbi:MAG: hypothetical protein H6739_29615 [Alphaproteobacteria bacterium]|nr:hypothetical protein [Alphaproteobacteria bacterium]
MSTTLLILALLAPGCSAERQALRAERQEARTIRMEARRLSEAADLYWRALRWEDLGTVAGFLENPDHRVQWMADDPTVRGGYRYRSAQVMRVDVAPLNPDDPAARREATVMVRIEGYQVNEQVIRQQLLTQTWYRTRSGWWVEPGQEYGVAQ